MSEKISVSLEPQHVRIVERFGKKTGIKQFSTALQALIFQFDQLQKAADPAKAADQPETAAAQTAQA